MSRRAKVPDSYVAVEKDAEWDEEPDVRIDTVNTPRAGDGGVVRTDLKAGGAGQGTKGQAITCQLFKDGAFVKGEQDGRFRRAAGRRCRVPVGNMRRVGIKHLPCVCRRWRKSSGTNDNEFAVNVQVVDAKRNRCLYVEGPPRWESKYLTRVLRASQADQPR